ncbi:hypothetical protein [Aeromonas jandaei]|uniref:hypothetical protein n=1 Tax=Aeromonas jandaei TaxID=650 RepID=UPI003B9EDAA7
MDYQQWLYPPRSLLKAQWQSTTRRFNILSKKAEREQRKQEKADRKREKSVRLQQAYLAEDLIKAPKFIPLPDIEKMPQTAAAIDTLVVPKQPKVDETGSRFEMRMTWCARLADLQGSWTWGESRTWTQQEWDDVISPGMNALEGNYWKDIQRMASDTRHLMHHDHDITDLCDEAIERWLELGLEQFDTPFRFRLGNLPRVWGVVLQGHFYMVWWDRLHRIYPV